VLSPLERGCEIVFGILMTVSVVAAAEIGTGGGAGVRDLLAAALGCNLAWGLIDAVIYLLQQQFARFRNHRTLRELRTTSDEAQFRRRVRAELPPLIGPTLTSDTYAGIRAVAQGYGASRPSFWTWRELAAAATICLLVLGATFPLVVPFLLMSDAWLALRISNAIAVAMLFLLGWWIGRWSGASPLRSGTLLATVGATLAILCIALGG
jgi:hypothetical protein